MLKAINDAITIADLIGRGMGPALILSALNGPKPAQNQQDGAVVVHNNNQALLERTLALETKVLEQGHENECEIHALKLRVEALEETQVGLTNKLSHLEEENEFQFQINEEKNKGKELDSLLKYF